MKSPASSIISCARSRAFTLIEIMVVVGIIVILTVLVMPSVGPLLRSSKMNTAATLITDSFDLARQTALTQNRDVEIRFYQLPSTVDPSKKQFRAFRAFFVYEDGSDPTKAQALSKINYLPNAVIISAAPQFSPLLDYATNGSCLTYGNEDLRGSLGLTAYVSFRFRATGGTNLSLIPVANGSWFLTLYLENAPNAANGIPANYFTAQIDPVTGRVRSYRP